MIGKEFLRCWGKVSFFFTLGIWGCNAGPGGSDETCPTGSTGAATTVSYANDIVPLFVAAGCMSSVCHGGTFPSSEYDLGTYESSFERGMDAERLSVCNIVPGEPESSFLVEKIREDEPRVGARMPLSREPLTEEQIVLIETWIREGAQNN